EGRADRHVAVLREAAGELAVELVPAWHMVRHDHTGVRAWARGTGKVGQDIVAARAFDGRGLGDHAVVGASIEAIPHVHHSTSSLRAIRQIGRGDSTAFGSALPLQRHGSPSGSPRGLVRSPRDARTPLIAYSPIA